MVANSFWVYSYTLVFPTHIKCSPVSQIVFIPLWIVMCVALIGVLYAIILAIILLKSPDIIPEQKRGNMFSAVGYTCLVVPLLVFEVSL